MKKEEFKYLRVISFLVIAFLASGCVKTFRMHPQFYERVRSVRTVGLIPPSIKVYQISAGGVPELMDEWTAKAQENISKAVEELFSDRADYVMRPFPQDRMIEQELKDIQALYDAVGTSIHLHTYAGNPDQTFPERVKSFDYTLGSEAGNLSRLVGSGALFFISGFDQISTGGRQAMIGFGMLIAGLIGANPALFGPQPGVTLLECALVDSTSGDILWYNTQAVPATYDLRNPSNAKSFVTVLLKDLPGPKEKL